jgi:hypothetical protein
VLSPTTTDEREAWLRRRTPAWAERYGGEWDRVQSLVEASAAARDRQRAEEALARQREEQSKLREQRFKYLLGGSALLGLLLIAAVYFAIQAAHERNRARQETDLARRALDDARSEFEKAGAARDRGEALAASAQQSANTILGAIEQLRSSGGGAGGGQSARAAVQQIEVAAKTLSTPDLQAAAAPGQGPRVYVHITDEQYRDAARRFELALEGVSVGGANIVVPGIELVKSAPTRPALRCFQREECQGEAGQILIAANDLLLEPKLELQDLSARYGGTANVRPHHYEIWFNSGLTPGTSAKP